jgi:hypothetical protein
MSEDLLAIIAVPAILAFAVVGAITWNLKSAVRWAVFSGIASPVLFFGLLFGWIIYTDHARRAAGVSSHEPASKAGMSQDGFTVLRSCVPGTQQCVCYDAASCRPGDRLPGGARVVEPDR